MIRSRSFWLLLIGALVYANSFRGAFVFDDVSSIINNPAVQQGWPWRAVWSSSSRPLTEWTFALNFSLGGLHPFGYHVVSLLLFCLASFLIYLFCYMVFQNYFLGILTSIFYLVHPINGVAVNHIVALGFPLSKEAKRDVVVHFGRPGGVLPKVAGD